MAVLGLIVEAATCVPCGPRLQIAIPCEVCISQHCTPHCRTQMLTEHSQPSGLTPCAGMAYRGSSTYPGDEGRNKYLQVLFYLHAAPVLVRWFTPFLMLLLLLLYPYSASIRPFP